MGRLTYAKAKSLQKAGLYGDGGTLFLKVQVRNGRVTKSWVQRVTIKGRRRDIGHGAFPLVSLADARERAFDIRRLARRGEDPKPRAVPTFREATERAYKALRPRWRSKKTADRWLRTMESHAYPRLAEMPVDGISRADVLDVLTPLWTEKPGIARKLRQSIKATFQWARAKGYLDDNPAGEAIDGALPRMRSTKAHYRALDYRGVGAALETIAECNASLAARACLQFVILTACRNGEARGATWAEVDLESRVWRIPASRMKNQREHRVPLSEAAMGALEQARALEDESGLVFPSPVRRGRQMSDMTLSKVLRDTGLAERATVHGFRSTFRQWASECTDADHAVMELCLAHMIGSETERAYARSDLIAKRRRLMNRWGRYASGATGNVIALAGR